MLKVSLRREILSTALPFATHKTAEPPIALLSCDPYNQGDLPSSALRALLDAMRASQTYSVDSAP